MNRAITTAAELEALPQGSVVLDRSGIALQMGATGWWTTTNMRSVSSVDIGYEGLPATLLHDGNGTAQPNRQNPTHSTGRDQRSTGGDQMSDYTPSTEDVRDSYTRGEIRDGNGIDHDCLEAGAYSQFYRWFNAERARTWDEAADQECGNCCMTAAIPPNPYRKDTK